jgi:hypothetical protein
LEVERSLDGNTIDWEKWLASGVPHSNPVDAGAFLDVRTNANSFGAGFGNYRRRHG